MLVFLTIVHLIVAVFLVLFVLLQDSKGGAMGVFGGGGGSNTVFGSTGAASFLVKITRYTAILFAATCIGLAYLSSKPEGSVLDKYAPQKASVPPIDQMQQGAGAEPESATAPEATPEEATGDEGAK